MARYARSQGQGPKKTRPKSKLKASIHYFPDKKGMTKRVKINDGDRGLYWGSGHNRPMQGKKGTGRPNLIRKQTSGKMPTSAAEKDFINRLSDKAFKRYQKSQASHGNIIPNRKKK